MLSVFFYKNRKVLAFLLLLIVSFTMMGTSSTSFTLNLKSIVLTIIYPFEYVINGIFNFSVPSGKVWARSRLSKRNSCGPRRG